MGYYDIGIQFLLEIYSLYTGRYYYLQIWLILLILIFTILTTLASS